MSKRRHAELGLRDLLHVRAAHRVVKAYSRCGVGGPMRVVAVLRLIVIESDVGVGVVVQEVEEVLTYAAAVWSRE